MLFSQSSEDNALSLSIAQQIFNQILKGELQPNNKIIEGVYAEKLNLSRSPVREAIYLLATEGIVERVPRKGAFVRAYNEREIFDLLEIRNELEFLSAKRLKDTHLQAELLEKALTLLEEMEKIEDTIEYTYLNYEFHLCLIQFSGSVTIEDVYRKISLRLLQIQVLHFSDEKRVKNSRLEHRRLYDALLTNDLETFMDILRAHTTGVLSSFSSSKAEVK